MNAQAKIPVGQALKDAIWLLESRALIRAYLEYEHQYEHLADAVDPLQEFAEQSGLVAAIGPDRVQELIAAPFARFRAIVTAEIEDELGGIECEPELPSDYASQLRMQWELADVRDRWKWTGELPLKPEPEADWPARKAYKTPEATVEAFKFLISLGDRDRLEAWLLNHPNDAVALFNVVEGA